MVASPVLKCDPSEAVPLGLSGPTQVSCFWPVPSPSCPVPPSLKVLATRPPEDYRRSD